MKDPLITVHQEDPRVAVISLNRPEKRNALNVGLMEAFIKEFEKAIERQQQRVLILRGEGAVFCAGLDLADAADLKKSKRSADLIAKVLTMIYQCPFPTIAIVQGAALAGGAGIMSACDFAIAEAHAVFGFPETRRGLVAAMVMTFLHQQIRQRDLKKLLLTGSLIDAQTAKTIGLINDIVESAEALLPAAFEVAESILQGAPNATKSTKHLLHELSGRHFSADLDKALHIHEKIRQSEEAQEGIKAFLEHRYPNWIAEGS